MELRHLIDEFDSAAGLEHAPAAEGVWKYSADGHVFGITADDSGERLFIFGEVEAPPPERAEAFRDAVLKANFFGRGTGGATFSLNPDTEAYTLVQSDRIDSLNPGSFFLLVEKFVNTLATWNGIAAAADLEKSSFDGDQEGGQSANAGHALSKERPMGEYMQV